MNMKVGQRPVLNDRHDSFDTLERLADDAGENTHMSLKNVILSLITKRHVG